MHRLHHFCQVYSGDDALLDVLEPYVADGLLRGEGVIVIATPAHRASLAQRLEAFGIDVRRAVYEDRFITADAEETLRRFMVNGAPDPKRFEQISSAAIARARGAGRAVRAFGEMVTLLWTRGQYAAAVCLEDLWNQLLDTEPLPLLCAYPKAEFGKGPSESIMAIERAHSKVIAA